MDIFTLVGTMTLKGQDKVQQQLAKTEERAQKVAKGFKIMGAAFTAVGAAGLVMANSARKMNAQLGVTALNLGISTKEMRNLALETTNVTFPLKEVIATFDFLARAGIENTEVLKATATAFDTLGDAIGLGASQVTEIMVPAMKTFRLSAEEIASKIDMMTFVVRKSTISLDDFNTMVGYTDQEMVDAGFTIDDMAAAMMYLSDTGVEPGKVMLREWNKAVTRSKEEGIAMTEALGMTSEELEKYKEKLAGATGMAKEYGDMMNTQLGIMDKLRQKWAELTLQYGTFLQPLEPILATMTALGPVMMLFSTVLLPRLTFTTAAARVKLIALAITTKVVTAAQWLWNAALTANPIGIVIVAVGALIAAGIALWRNWDKVTDFFKKAWSNIKVFFLSGVESILESLTKFTSWIPGLGAKIQEAHDAIVNMIDAEQVAKDARELQGEVEKLAKGMVDTIRKQLEEERDLKLKALQDSKSLAQTEHDDRIDQLRKTYGVLEREDEKYQDNKLGAARRATDEAIALIDKEYNARLRLLDNETAAIISDYQARIDAIDAQTEAEELIAKKAERARRLAELEEAVASAETAEDGLRAINELEKYQARIDRERLLEGRRDEKDALREQIEETRKAASQQRDRLQSDLLDKKIRLDQDLKEELTRIDDERIMFEEAETAKLVATQERLNQEEKDLIEHYKNQLTETELHVAAINAATKEIVDRAVTVTITTVHRDIFEGAGATGMGGGGGDDGGGGFPSIEKGGIAIRETLARIGERAPSTPEAIIPLDRATLERLGMGGRTVNIIVELDSRVLAKAMGQPLVDEIRIRTGARF